MAKILLTVYLNMAMRILWNEVSEEQERLAAGGMAFESLLFIAILVRCILWPVILLINWTDLFIKGLPRKEKGA